MRKWKHLHAGAKLHTFCLSGDGREHCQRRTHHRTVGLLMDLGQPDRVESPLLPGANLIEAHREGIRIRLLLHLTVKLVVPSDFHVRVPTKRRKLRSATRFGESAEPA